MQEKNPKLDIEQPGWSDEPVIGCSSAPEPDGTRDCTYKQVMRVERMDETALEFEGPSFTTPTSRQCRTSIRSRCSAFWTQLSLMTVVGNCFAHMLWLKSR